MTSIVPRATFSLSPSPETGYSSSAQRFSVDNPERVARKSSSTAVQEELYSVARGPREYDSREHDGSPRAPFDVSRVIDLEDEQESPFLRAQKRVSARRSTLPKSTANGLKWGAAVLVALGLAAGAGVALYRYGKYSWRFRIDSSDQIEVSGALHVPHAQIMEVMGSDIGRNIFFVPLDRRKQQIEQLPWVESASVMRFVPNRLRIEIHERTPVAFARVGSHICLADASGTLMDLERAPRQKYSFPVITGMSASEAPFTRAARMKNYNELIRQLDSGGTHYSQDISEVDLADAEDVKLLTADPAGGVVVHLGNSNYLQRYKVYVAHIEAWRQQFEKLDSVDLRYDGQIIVNPDLEGIVHQPALTPAAAKAALAAGAKNSAIVNYEKFVDHPEQPGPASRQAPAKPKSKVPLNGSRKVSHQAVANRASKPRPKPAVAVAPHQTSPTTSAKPIATEPVPVTAPPGSQKKPSPVVERETPPN